MPLYIGTHENASKYDSKKYDRISQLFARNPKLRDETTWRFDHSHLGVFDCERDSILYVMQGETAIVSPIDESISFILTDDTTTCVTGIVRHRDTGVTMLTHYDRKVDSYLFRQALCKQLKQMNDLAKDITFPPTTTTTTTTTPLSSSASLSSSLSSSTYLNNDCDPFSSVENQHQQQQQQQNCDNNSSDEVEIVEAEDAMLAVERAAAAAVGLTNDHNDNDKDEDDDGNGGRGGSDEYNNTNVIISSSSSLSSSDTVTTTTTTTTAVNTMETIFDLYLIGGFADEHNISEDLLHFLLGQFSQMPFRIHLCCAFIGELNTILIQGGRSRNSKSSIPRPIAYGAAINLRTGQVYNAKLNRHTTLYLKAIPMYTIRRAALTFSYVPTYREIYDPFAQEIAIQPMPFDCCWSDEERLHCLKLAFSYTTEELLQNFSTSPLVEPEHFCDELRESFAFFLSHRNKDITELYFPGGKTRRFRRVVEETPATPTPMIQDNGGGSASENSNSSSSSSTPNTTPPTTAITVTVKRHRWTEI